MVNYTYIRNTDRFVLSEPTGLVYADKPQAVLNTDLIYNEPLVIPMNGRMTVVDRKTYEDSHKIFYLTSDSEGKVTEDTINGAPVWLPRNTDISRIRYKMINGKREIVLVDKNAEEEEEQKKDEHRQKKTKESEA